MRLYLVHKAFEVKESNKKWMSLRMVIYGEINYRVHWIIYCLLIVNNFNFSNWILIKFYSFLIIRYRVFRSTRNKDTSFRCSKWKKKCTTFLLFWIMFDCEMYKQMYNRYKFVTKSIVPGTLFHFQNNILLDNSLKLIF